MQMISVVEEKENDTGNNYRSCGKRSVQHNKRFGEEKEEMTLEDYIVQQLKDDEFAREYIRVHKPIIRCKDCKYRDNDYCKEHHDHIDREEFCSRGERAE